MARPTKTGLSYFPVDVDIFEDEKLQFISAKYGLKGEAIVFRLLSKIYRNGYYIEFDEDVQLLFSKSCGLERNDNATRNVVSELLKRNFFDKTLFEQFQVLTSKGIQKRYLRICHDSKRVACNLLPKYDLTQEKYGFPREETIINSTGNTTKESKEKKSKENQSILYKGENFEKNEENEIPVFVVQNRENVAPPEGGRPERNSESLKADILQNEICKMKATLNGIGVAEYEKAVSDFVSDTFGLGKNKNWQNIADARQHFINWTKYYKNGKPHTSTTQGRSIVERPAAHSTIATSPDGTLLRVSGNGVQTFAG